MAKGKYEYWLTTEGQILLRGWARDGDTDEIICKKMGVGYSTLQAWKAKYQDIQDSLKMGKETVDYAVENALFRNAMSGDTTAQIFWLKNRRRDRWRDKPQDEDRQKEEVKIILERRNGNNT